MNPYCSPGHCAILWLFSSGPEFHAYSTLTLADLSPISGVQRYIQNFCFLPNLIFFFSSSVIGPPYRRSLRRFFCAALGFQETREGKMNDYL